ncbi:MAG: 30S ribosome-binding factor RbfA [Chitinophagaceae bacterium]|uniref:30S ribosome-binding factor RbfA n=1 Tax=unclassified Paraflavitalea TaxID=2798305 RepID=UPI003D34E6D0|nr:30S ribosome-binding factor RbfA [Chitinophagaceae bacterium]
MQEGKRQKQVAGLIQEEMNAIFQRLGLTMMDGGMVSISGVKVTPDLLEARIYISLFQVADPKITMKKIEDRGWEIKKELTARVAKQLRRMPEIRYYHDDTLDQVFKIENLLQQIKKDEGKKTDEA